MIWNDIKDSLKKEEKVEKKISDEEAAKKLDDLLAKQRMDFCFGKPESFEKPITYCITDKGMFQVRKNRIGIFSAKVESFDTFPTGEIEAKMELSVPKIPLDLLNRTVGFFKKVNEKHSTEAHVQFIYDTEKKEYSIFVPEQDVSGASVKYENKETNEILKDSNKILVMDIHSHNTMGAFFSSTDDKDEKRDQVYGVIGKLNQDVPEMKFRYACGGKHVDIAMEEIFEVEKPDYAFPEEWLKKLKEKKWSSQDDDDWQGYGYGRGYYRNQYALGPAKHQKDKEHKKLDGIIDKYSHHTGKSIYEMTEKEWEQSEGMYMPNDQPDLWNREEYEAKRDWCDPSLDDMSFDEALENAEIEDIIDGLVNRDKDDWVKVILMLIHEDPQLVNRVVNKMNHRRKKNGSNLQPTGGNGKAVSQNTK